MLQSGSLVSRGVALGILAIVILATFQLLVQPVMNAFRDKQKEVAKLETILQRYQLLIAERPKIIERLDAFKGERRAATFHLESPSEALAAAELQDLISTVVESAGGQIKSVQPLPIVDADDGQALRKNGMKIRFSADVDTLTEATYELESIEPLLIIERLQISSVGMRMNDEEQQAVPMLDVRIEVFGYARRR